MTFRATQEWLDDYLKRQGKQAPAPLEEEKPERSKYNNKIVYVDGVMFRSRKEADRYGELKLLLRSGEAWGLILQPKFILIDGDKEKGIKPITYSADFVVIYPGMVCEVEDTKGMETEQWKRTYKMFKARYPNIELRVIK